MTAPDRAASGASCWSRTPAGEDARERRPPVLPAADRARPRWSGCWPDEADELDLDPTTTTRRSRSSTPTADAGAGCELALVIGGDGTILRAAELTRESADPAARGQPRARRLPGRGRARRRRAHHRRDRAPALHRRGAADPRRARSTATRSWSPAPWRSTRPASRRPPGERMIEVVVEIDGRPLSRWGCDGVVLRHARPARPPTTSAPAGPIVWPGVEALLMVPISAHALFARPMVVAPDSVLAVEVIARTDGAGRAVVRRPPHRRPAARRPDRGAPRARPGAAGPAAPGAVHRPAGRQVRPARRGLARGRRAPPARRRPEDGADA